MPNRTWKFHSGRLLLVAFAVLFVGWITGHLMVVIAAAIAVFVGWHGANLWRLYRWLNDPEKKVPESFGIWSDIYDNIDSLEKSNQRQRERYQEVIGEFRSLTDAFPDATLVVDRNDNITWFNSAAKDLLELRSPKDLGQPITNLVRRPDFADWLAVHEEVESPLEMRSPRSESTWLHASAVAFRDQQRLIILRDITEVHNLEKIRRDFVANISHELRTPLTVLQGYLELMENHPSSDVSEAVNRMRSQALQIQTLLDDLLELSRLQSEEAHGEEQTVNVPAILMQLKEQAEEINKGKKSITFEVDDNLRLSGVAADLESAFSNLITNAVKYSKKGDAITVTWRGGPDGPQFIVQDTGIGIPRRDIPRLTERFYRVGSDRARATGGTGLGLAIVKHVLNAHQAELSIESELGEGSTFTCSFPPERRRDEP